jgi:hypothetical protein
MKDSRQANMIQMFLNNVKSWYWIGLKDVKDEGVFVWSVSQTNVSWTNWSPGEPNGGTNENCVVSTVDARWGDVWCGANAFALCHSCKYFRISYKNEKKNMVCQ